MAPGPRPAGRSRKNTDPTPNALSTTTLPPIKSANSLQIDSPRPAPSKRWIVNLPTSAKGESNHSIVSASMPVPLSLTAKRMASIASGRWTLSTLGPTQHRTWVDTSIRRCRVRPRSATIGAREWACCSRTSMTPTSRISISSYTVSIIKKLKTSLIGMIKLPAEFRTACNNQDCSVSSFDQPSCFNGPRSPMIGVRIS